MAERYTVKAGVDRPAALVVNPTGKTGMAREAPVQRIRRAGRL